MTASLRNDSCYFCPANVSVDQVDITISDTAHAIQLGRLFLGAAFEGFMPIEYGNATVGIKPLTEVQTVPSGVRYYGAAQAIRTATLTYKELTEVEMFSDVFTAQMISGVSGEVIFSYMGRPVYVTIGGASAQSLAFFARCFIGNVVELNPVSHAFFNAFGTVLQIEEVAK